MTFNHNLSKQAQEVTFSRKTVKISHPSLTFNTVPVRQHARCTLVCIFLKNNVCLIISMKKFQKQIRRLES